MSKGKLVALAVVGLLAWQHQEALAPHLQTVRQVGPTFSAFMEMRTYKAALLVHMNRNDGRPPRDLTEWLDQSYPPKGTRSPSMDTFGREYETVRDRELGWVLRSCGPDTVCENEDDLLMPLTVGS